MPNKTARKPKIVISRSDHDRLLGLADVIEDREPALADVLITELERARIVEDSKLPENVVRMGSTITYTADDGEPQTATLVFPGDADIAAGKISITTPFGTALIGLSPGQSIDWMARNGKTHRLTVTEVHQPAEHA
ncbi:nucleoside diphosphate kinase regulator [Chelativorans sp. YIM 93263]|uniref:nucleoside diphosphate kinase regulator n=1 Tax=Chelativorans sp. YIM 93263 TaxID=2906648 RepID=UPI0023799243|nr:nucleoside diphosphate kinase regulator [Chelativorans sp. YIM 93263]